MKRIILLLALYVRIAATAGFAPAARWNST
jgi:hypothetical protein